MLAILKEAAVPGKNIVFFLDVAYIDYAGEKKKYAKSLKAFRLACQHSLYCRLQHVQRLHYVRSAYRRYDRRFLRQERY